MFFKKWLPVATTHFGCPKITLCRISYHFRSIPQFFLFGEIFFTKMVAGDHFGCLKITFGRISGHFRSIRNFNFYKMPAGAHFGCPKFTFDRISVHFRSIRNFIFFSKFLFLQFFLQHGCRRTFWMSENHFRSHFWTFHINTKLFIIFFYKMAAVGHFGCSKFTLDHISGHFYINTYFLFFWIFFTKWLPVAILIVRKSLSISFLSISHRYTTLFFF